MKETALCIDFLNGDCSLNEKCTWRHSPYKTPYLWQYKYVGGTSWENFDQRSNEDIEKVFRDPCKTESGYTSYPKLKVSFQHIPFAHESHFTDGINMLYRRLSTRFSVRDNDDIKLSVTHWKWYWEKCKPTNVWEEYKSGVGLPKYIFFKEFQLTFYISKSTPLNKSIL